MGGEFEDSGDGKVTYAGGFEKVHGGERGYEDGGGAKNGESDGPKRRAQKAGAPHEGKTQSCDHDVRRSRRDSDDVVQKGRKRAGLKRAVSSESGGYIDDHPQTRLRLGGEVIELFDDDEISVVSEDVGDEKTLGKKMDKHKQDILMWNNRVGKRIEQKLADTYKKMGCITAVECYSLMLGQYSVELSNSYKLAVYDYVYPIYKTTTQRLIYNQLVHPMKTHDIGIVDGKTGRVVDGDELDEDCDHCILPLNNGRQPAHRLAIKCKNVHEDHDKYAAVMPTAIPL
ncbi:LOW QUALITY PROTEIN: hypothetical protein Cgig2_007102 [Carnegiea gigantea]|uniref:Uncharacterized protein n=1 Tax=Carnegiea gigantea TaxID=171969 RepID=A0A9Q1JU13_9CARY|nr:LOW QUALITY PROTEIN: hypothetical protein Cgig2_007102 [Carnegiea gigantea]